MSNSLISKERHEEIAQTIQEIFSKYDSSRDVGEYLEEIINDNNIEFLEGDIGDLSGFLEKVGGVWRMTINASDSASRRIFTIAHELGHFFLHKDKETSFVDGGYASSFARTEETKWARLEVEANEFAGQLVMPLEKIQALLGRESGKVSPLEIRTLADKLRVSQYAMAVRLRNLSYSV